jgi:hypothetical protein
MLCRIIEDFIFLEDERGENDEYRDTHGASCCIHLLCYQDAVLYENDFRLVYLESDKKELVL